MVLGGWVGGGCGGGVGGGGMEEPWSFSSRSMRVTTAKLTRRGKQPCWNHKPLFMHKQQFNTLVVPLVFLRTH